MTDLADQPLSPLDGRYRAATAPLAVHLSEAGLNRARVHVEVEWLIALTDAGVAGTRPLDDAQRAALRAIVTGFGAEDVAELAAHEAVTRHDVKAVEYFLRDRLDPLGLGALAELVHFACTSEDINNLAVALTVQAGVRDVWLPALDVVVERLRALAMRLGRRPDARADPRPAGDADDHGQGAGGLRAPPRAHPRRASPPSRSRARRTARAATSPRTSSRLPRSTGRRSRADSSPASASCGTR